MGDRGCDSASPDESAIGEEISRDEGPDDSSVTQDFEAELHAAGVSFGRDDAELIRAIDEAGSLNEAASSLSRSYSRAHQRLRTLEGAFGTLVESQRGGVDGGGSVVTKTARHLLAEFSRLRTEFSGLTAVAETVVDGRIVHRDGELAVVETSAGRLRARAPVDAVTVSVTIRADTVTLHASDGAPDASETSARNRFRGTVVGLDERESVVRVSLDVGFDHALEALITADSKRELELVAGSPVLASFKTTATRAVPRE